MACIYTCTSHQPLWKVLTRGLHECTHNKEVNYFLTWLGSLFEGTSAFSKLLYKMQREALSVDISIIKSHTLAGRPRFLFTSPDPVLFRPA